MKRKIILSLALLVLLPNLSFGQRRVTRQIIFKYPNGNLWTDTVGDSVANAAIDTVTFGILSKGGLSPVSVTVAIMAKGVGATVDSLNVTYQAGFGGDFYTTVGSAQTELAGSITTSGLTAIRTLVFNTTGANVALNTQAGVFPHCSAMKLILTQPTNDSETISYRLRIWGVYEE
ncbi:MAG: hypothetical protein ACE5HX_05890 [bacterium]